jgi:hypothetical protein
MAWTNWKYLNFRSWSGYVTDDANSIAVVDLTLVASGSGLTTQSQVYPVNVTVDGDNFDYGYTATPGGTGETRDRSSADNPPKLAGTHFAANDGASQHKFRINVSAGTYDISLALGDDSSTFTGMYCRVLDDTTPRITLSGLNMSTIGRWYDATGVERTSRSDWLANQVTVSANISSGILIVELATPTNVGSNTGWNHLAVRKQTAAAGVALMGQIVT